MHTHTHVNLVDRAVEHTAHLMQALQVRCQAHASPKILGCTQKSAFVCSVYLTSQRHVHLQVPKPSHIPTAHMHVNTGDTEEALVRGLNSGPCDWEWDDAPIVEQGGLRATSRGGLVKGELNPKP